MAWTRGERAEVERRVGVRRGGRGGREEGRGYLLKLNFCQDVSITLWRQKIESGAEGKLVWSGETRGELNRGRLL